MGKEEGSKIPEEVVQQIAKFLSDKSNYEGIIKFTTDLKNVLGQDIIESVGDPNVKVEELVPRALYLRGKLDMLKGLVSYLARWRSDVIKIQEEERKAKF